MQCANCGCTHEGDVRYCRHCGIAVAPEAIKLAGRPDLQMLARADQLERTSSTDPDELVGAGLSKVIGGDGFFMVAVFLSLAQTAVGSLLWLVLLIPAFYLFGQGFADVFRARQLRRRQKEADRLQAAGRHDLRPATVLIGDVFTGDTTRKLQPSSGGLPPQS